jgi:hypothetical protein
MSTRNLSDEHLAGIAATGGPGRGAIRTVMGEKVLRALATALPESE